MDNWFQLLGNYGNGYFNHDNGYSDTQSLSAAANSNLGWLLDPTGTVAGLWNDITGVSAQSREFSQQEYLQDKQNEYNTPVNQMARMTAAGINPNLAASGIAGGGNESAQAPAVPNATNSAASGVGALASGISGFAGAALSMAQKRQADAQANLFNAQTKEINTLLEPKMNQIIADTAKTWTDNGMDQNIADYWSVKVAYADQNERLDIYSKCWSIKKCKTEIDELKAQIANEWKDLEIKKEKLSQEEYRTEQMRIDTKLKQGIESIYDAHGINLQLPEHAMLVEAAANGNLDLITDAFGKLSYAQAYEAYKADVDTLTDRLKKNFEFQKNLSRLGVASDVQSELIDTFIHYLFGTGFGVNIGPVGVKNDNPH